MTAPDDNLEARFAADAMTAPLPGAMHMTFGRHRGARAADVARAHPRYAARIILDGEFGGPELHAELWRFLPAAYQDQVCEGLGMIFEDDDVISLLAARER